MPVREVVRQTSLHETHTAIAAVRLTDRFSRHLVTATCGDSSGLSGIGTEHLSGSPERASSAAGITHRLLLPVPLAFN